MAVITITIEESSVQIISGIPKSISMTTNVPSSIYYTLDGTTPTITSLIYAGGDLTLPTDQTSVILNVFATDGVDSSPIITQVYAPNIVQIRQAHDEVLNATQPCCEHDSFPYSDVGPQLPTEYGNVAGDVVDRYDVPSIPSGYDGTATGTGTGDTDRPLDTYELVYSETDWQGERGHGIGTLPSTVIIEPQESPPESSDRNSAFFNPRALVIYQDSTKEPYDPNISQINRNYFSLENLETVKDGTLLDPCTAGGIGPTGSFVRTAFNPKENIMTYYYFDSQTLRWIIAREPYNPKVDYPGALFSILFSSRQQGSRNVYEWRPFGRRRLI